MTYCRAFFAGGLWAPGCRARHVDNVDCPSWARGCNCGQVGQPKNKLSTMPTNTKEFWEKEKAQAEKQGKTWTTWTLWTRILNRWLITSVA